MFAFNLIRTVIAASAVTFVGAFDQCCAGGQCGMDSFDNNSTTCPSPSTANSGDSLDDSCDGEGWGCTPAPGNMCGMGDNMCGAPPANNMCGADNMCGTNSTANFDEMKAEYDANGTCGMWCQLGNAVNSTLGFNNQTNDEIDSFDSL